MAKLALLCFEVLAPMVLAGRFIKMEEYNKMGCPDWSLIRQDESEWPCMPVDDTGLLYRLSVCAGSNIMWEYYFDSRCWLKAPVPSSLAFTGGLCQQQPGNNYTWQKRSCSSEPTSPPSPPPAFIIPYTLYNDRTCSQQVGAGELNYIPGCRGRTLYNATMDKWDDVSAHMELSPGPVTQFVIERKYNGAVDCSGKPSEIGSWLLCNLCTKEKRGNRFYILDCEGEDLSFAVSWRPSWFLSVLLMGMMASFTCLRL